MVLLDKWQPVYKHFCKPLPYSNRRNGALVLKHKANLCIWYFWHMMQKKKILQLFLLWQQFSYCFKVAFQGRHSKKIFFGMCEYFVQYKSLILMICTILWLDAKCFLPFDLCWVEKRYRFTCLWNSMNIYSFIETIEVWRF